MNVSRSSSRYDRVVDTVQELDDSVLELVEQEETVDVKLPECKTDV